MQYGFIKVCAATPEIRVADVKFNTENIINGILEGEKNGAQLIVFPELSVTGYTCGDLFNQELLISSALNAINDICIATKNIKTLCFVGAPLEFNGKLYNCALAISQGKVLGIVPKSYLPTYGEFYEGRHFIKAEKQTSNVDFLGDKVPFGTDIIFKANGVKEFTVACEICEDLWVPNSPSIRHAKAGANVIVNLSCSDETVGKAEYRRKLVSLHSAKLLSAYIYADSGFGESTTDMVFAGHNIICENGTILKESKLFKNCSIYSEIDVERLYNEKRRTSNTFFDENDSNGYTFVSFETDNKEGKLERKFSKTPFVPTGDQDLKERADLILSIQANALAKRLLHSHAKTAVIGISGGLDSALALLVTRRAFELIEKPYTDIIAVTMPGFGTTGRTYENSLSLINSIGATAKTISIAESVKVHFADIGQEMDNYDVTYENSQARMRTMILMDLANKTGGMVIGTGDLSELALGWATYNGDHMSMYSVNCSVPKTLVKYLVRSEAKNLGGEAERVLIDIFNTEISPELLPPDKDGKIAQKTEDLVGPYILHDFFLYHAIRWGFAPQKVKYLATITFDEYDEATIDKWVKNFYRRFFNQQFKRSCVPDGVKVGSVSLSPRGDWRMPSDAISSLWLEDI